jgi:hypothetical protein
MVPGSLAEVADRVDQHQGRGPAVGRVLAAQPVAVGVVVSTVEPIRDDPGLDFRQRIDLERLV